MSEAGRPVLYTYWRSTAAYRARIALNLKGVDYESCIVDLVADGGRQHDKAYRALNPAGLIPALEIDGQLIRQSLAICEYLEETRPQPPLLPADPVQRAWVRALAQDVACDIHPINNLRVQQYLKRELDTDDDGARRWMEHWMHAGFSGIEKTLAASGLPGLCCAGNEPGLADIFLVGQVYNADRFGVDMGVYPRSMEIVTHCRSLPAFLNASPEAQPDAPSG